MEFAIQLREARHDAGLTQVELANRAGTSQSRLSSYEKGLVTPNRSTKARLLKATRTRPSEVIEEMRDEILEIATDNGLSNVRVFGSIARHEDTVKSDIDLLVTPCRKSSLFDIASFLDAVRDATGFKVDVVSDRAVPDGAEILQEAMAL